MARALVVLCLAALFASSVEAAEVKRILWRAEPEQFATSLFWGILGRKPSGAADRTVYWKLALHVTINPFTRLEAFWMLADGDDSRWEHEDLPCDQWVAHSLYPAHDGLHRWTVVKKDDTDRAWVKRFGPFRYPFACAVRDYFKTWQQGPKGRFVAGHKLPAQPGRKKPERPSSP